MSQNDNTAAIKKMITLREGGAKWPEVLRATGLNHVVAEREWMRHNFIKGGGKVIAATTENVVNLRNQGFSWGEITVRVGAKSESPVRRLYEGSGELSQGIRIGRGGRYFLGDPTLYEDTLQPTGTVLKKGELATRHQAAFTQKLAKMEIDQIKQMAKDAGVTTRKGATKAQIIIALAKKLGYAEAAKAEAEAQGEEVKAS